MFDQLFKIVPLMVVAAEPNFVIPLRDHAVYSYDLDEFSLKEMGHPVSDNVHHVAEHFHYKTHGDPPLPTSINLRASFREFQNHPSVKYSDVDVVMRLENQKNSEYLGEVAVGDPPQPFKVVFDSASTNFWIDSVWCTAKSCLKNRRYDPLQSKHYVDVGGHKHIEFGTASLDGHMVQDDVFVGPFRIRNQRFGAVTDAKGSVWSNIPMEGILGLGFPSLSAMGPSPFFDSIINQNILHANQFAFYVSPSKAGNSAVMFGGADPQYYKGELACFKVEIEKFWLVNVNSFTLEFDHSDKEPIVIDAPPYAIFDTGSNLYTVDPEYLPGITKHMPRVPKMDSSTWAAALKTLPTMVWRLPTTDGQEFAIRVPPNEYYATHPFGDGFPAWMAITCEEPDGPAFMFGQLFMHYWYTLFDRGSHQGDAAEVCVARANHDYATTVQVKRMEEKTQLPVTQKTNKRKRASSLVVDDIREDEN